MFLCINVHLLDEDEKKTTDTKTGFQFMESIVWGSSVVCVVSLHIQFVVNIATEREREIFN